MIDSTNSLTLQMLEWIEARPRTRVEVLEAWRTSCPRLSIWEDACINGLIDYDPNGDRMVRLSAKGRGALQSQLQGRQL